MTSPLTTWMDTMKTAWEAKTPTSDGSSIAFAFIDDLIEERGNGQHRQLIWGRPQNADIEAEAASQLRWSITATLFLHRNDRTQEAFHKACANEVNDLFVAYSAAVWGAGVYEAVLGDITSDDNADETPVRAGGVRRSLVARYHFPFSVLVGAS